MSGPIRTLSGMIVDVSERIDEIHNSTDRLRMANRRLTGVHGRPSTPIGAAEATAKKGSTDEFPLMVQLTIVLVTLENAMVEMGAEIEYLEAFSETGKNGESGSGGQLRKSPTGSRSP